MKKVYAITRYVPKDCSYLKRNKKYAVLREDDNGGFFVKSEWGGESYCLWKGCAHLEFKNWTRVETEE